MVSSPVGSIASQPGQTESCGKSPKKEKTQFKWNRTRHSSHISQVITDLLVLLS